MGKEPHVGKYLDRDEEELVRAIESDAYEFGESALTPERKRELQTAARNTLNDERVQITLRISKHNLAKIKARALREGMPYQTMINSILHKAVS
jgi:predicted DNA binding CopG/RHH family protein